ncbi:hypothetical protein A3H11_01510 [Candidatus Uhrbacteria bacterium RIFCSPLOWO2_12_FULL_47_10]|nr:MAG: hypothetical protein A3H11_01510 [Candidatus Uhrbacteria bacterium RIFCSPLOWO2_12_FULL_47_10]
MEIIAFDKPSTGGTVDTLVRGGDATPIMPMDTLQQIAQRLRESEHTLIVFPYASDAKEGGDALGSALALFGYLKKIGKKADIVAHGFEPSGRLSFLPHVQNVQVQIARPQNYTLRIKTANAKLKELSYGIKNDALEIYLTPEHGALSDKDIELQRGKYSYDTIVTLDAPDLPTLGKLFEEHSELFYGTPIINIDHHAGNEQYGQINLVDINAAATGEVMAGVLRAMGAHHIDSEIATNLFAAIFLKTHGFKNPTITPNTLKLAAELIQLGARREEIMKNVFRSRSLASLRLWGRALAHLKHDPITKLTWSTLTTREILESGGDVRELPDVIEELIFTSPEASLMALIYEEAEGRVCVMLANKKPRQGGAHALPWDILETTHGLTKYCLLKHDLLSAEREVVEKLNSTLKLLPH